MIKWLFTRKKNSCGIDKVNLGRRNFLVASGATLIAGRALGSSNLFEISKNMIDNKRYKIILYENQYLLNYNSELLFFFDAKKETELDVENKIKQIYFKNSEEPFKREKIQFLDVSLKEMYQKEYHLGTIYYLIILNEVEMSPYVKEKIESRIFETIEEYRRIGIHFKSVRTFNEKTKFGPFDFCFIITPLRELTGFINTRGFFEAIRLEILDGRNEAFLEEEIKHIEKLIKIGKRSSIDYKKRIKYLRENKSYFDLPRKFPPYLKKEEVNYRNFAAVTYNDYTTNYSHAFIHELGHLLGMNYVFYDEKSRKILKGNFYMGDIRRGSNKRFHFLNIFKAKLFLFVSIKQKDFSFINRNRELFLNDTMNATIDNNYHPISPKINSILYF